MPTSADRPLHLYEVLEEEYISLHGPIRKDEDFFVEIADPEIENKFWCVNAPRNWFFHEGHIRNLAGFASRLLAAKPFDEKDVNTTNDTDPISTYIRRKLKENASDAELLRRLDEYKEYAASSVEAASPAPSSPPGREETDSPPSSPPCPPDPRRGAASIPPRTGTDFEQRLLRELNQILKDPDLYTEEHFKHVKLTPASAGLVELIDTFKAVKHDGKTSPASTTPLSSPPSAPEEEEHEDIAHLNRLLLEDAYPDVFENIRNLRLAAIYKRLHRQKQSALSLSGGGIRSGTFALGLLQGLARHKLLGQFDYLSTVSGGGYIGSWLTAWLHRHEDGLDGVTKDLANTNPEGKIDPDAEPLRYLRRYSNFITPQVGLMTADTWTFIGIYLRNLLLNWVVLIPIFAGALLIPRLVVGAILGQSTNPVARKLSLFGWTLPFPYYQRYGLLIIGTFLLIMALAYVGFNRPSAGEQLKQRSPFWRKQTGQSGFLIFCWMPLVVAAFCLTTYSAWSRAFRLAPPELWMYLFFGATTTLASWCWYTFVVLRRGRRDRWNEIRWLELLLLVAVGVVGGILFWLVAKRDFGDPVVDTVDASWLTWSTEIYACTAAPVFLLLFLLATFLYVGITSYNRGIGDEEREWLSRLGAWILIAVIIWLALSTLVIFGPLALLDSPKILASLGGVSGLIALLVGRSSVTPATHKDAAKASTTSLVVGNLLPMLTLVFLMIFIAALSLLTSLLIKGLFAGIGSLPAWLASLTDKDRESWTVRLGEWLAASVVGISDWLVSVDPFGTMRYLEELSRPAWMAGHMRTIHYPSFWFFLVLMVGLVGFGIIMARVINLNLFSLHGGYRNRLIRGFLGASRKEHERKPNPFTGFDRLDNVHMHELRPVLLHETDFETQQRTTDQNFKELALKIKEAGVASADGSAAPHSQTVDAMSHFLYAHLEDSKHKVDAYAGDAVPDATLKSTLLEDLNRILDDEKIRFDKEPSLRQYISSERVRRALASIRADESSGRPIRREYQIFLNRLMLEQAYKELIKQCPYPPPPYKLFHIINTALNLVGGDNLAWQQRKAEPFTISALHSGCFRLGYRKSRDYGGPDGISIGTAAAISGAAASSNMGYYTTSPVMSLLLTVFNVRLGWWLGNPGAAGSKTYRRPAPTLSLLPVLHEAFGMTDDKNPYVYLSDGGHFENLAVYEMVLRRCHIIVVSDGAEDGEYRFGDLGNAVRKIRIDLGVPIEFSKVLIDPALKDGTGLYWAVGKIRYSCVDKGAEDGVLVYIKPTVYELNEPRDVLEYKKNHSAFPHETTVDQFFDEPQFESYRMLGSFIMDQIAGEECERNKCPITDLPALARAAYEKSTKGDPGLKDLKFPAWLTGEKTGGDEATRTVDKDTGARV